MCVSGGNEELNAKRPGMKFYGADERIGALNTRIAHGDTFQIGSLKVTCFETPCHTTGHVCYLVEGEGAEPAVFTGEKELLSFTKHRPISRTKFLFSP